MVIDMDYAIIEDGKVVNVVVGPENWTPAGRQVVPVGTGCVIGASYANGVFAPPAEPAPPAPEPITRFSTLDYFSRFTDTEYAAARGGSMAIQRGLDMLIAAQYVDVTDPRVTEYLSAMVTAGIITDARKAELIAPQTA